MGDQGMNMGSGPWFSSLSFIIYPVPRPPTYLLTLIARKALNALGLCIAPFLCVDIMVVVGGGGWKGLQWSWECGKPSLVWSNHSCVSIILPPLLPPSDLSQTITHHTCLSPPFHYSHLTGQRIRVTLGGPLSFSAHIPSFYRSPITPSSLAGIWRVTLGQFNLLSPPATAALQSVAVSHL